MNNSHSSSKGSIWRWVKRILIVIGVLVLIFIFVVVPFGFSWLLTHASSRPSDSVMTETPAKYGVAFEPVSFESLDGTPLSGWWLPADSSNVVVIYSHGLFRSRLELLERAARLRQLGYAGLLFDFRRHGESHGELTSAGYLERLDVLGAVKFIHEKLSIQKPIVTFAVSMGTAATMLAAAESLEIAGLILDSSFLSFDHTVSHHINLLGLPAFPLANEVILFTKWRVGFENGEFDMATAVQKIGDRPILFIAGSADTRMPPEISQRLYELSPSQHKQLVIVEGATHGAAFRTNAELYEQKVVDFLSENFNHTDAPATN